MIITMTSNGVFSDPGRFLMLGTTGKAALQMNGRTLHSALMLGTGTESFNTIFKRLNEKVNEVPFSIFCNLIIIN